MPATYAAGAVAYHGETLSLTSTVASLGIPSGYQQAVVYCLTSDFRMHINPKLIDVRFFNESAAVGSEYETGGGTGATLLEDLTDRTHIGAGGTGTVLDSATGSDFLYLCFSEPIGGLRIDMSASVNATNNTMTVAYRKNDNTWSNLSITDGTKPSNDSLAQDGNVTWTGPTDWIAAQLLGPQGIVNNDVTGEISTATGFWLRLSWDNGLDSDTEIDEIWALNHDSDRGFFRAGPEYAISLDKRVIGSIEATVASGTQILEITWVKV